MNRRGDGKVTIGSVPGRMPIQSLGFCDPSEHEKSIYDKEPHFDKLTIAI